ncbi:serine/threonine protein phosphatase [Leptospira perolatii]|uniref:Serine/threonine protein phosphatase n=1 Tax=Leptospira perolatii TaxID=2023191 RepID=A0A2M9ZSY0_9LEPT|nr:SpoIIE family protein phosphatase [Leptospira perolatii]PJZ68083.1 serine/threonine protein phosphatase [Leptospira perolatii]PJZ75069.1 serine/threonine protein phosphatase [Leptospira perolatii]
MNPYLVIPLLALFLNLYLFTYVLALKGRHKVVNVYLIYSADLSLWIFSLVLYWSFLPESWMMWLIRITSFSWIFCGPLFLEFSFVFLGKRSNILLNLFRVFAIATYVLSLLTDLVIAGFVRKYWGDTLIPGPLYIVSQSVLFLGTTSYSVFLLLFESKKFEPGFRKQCYLLAGGTLLTTLFGFITTVLPRVFQQGTLIYPPLSGSASVIQSVCTFIAISKYGFLEIRLERIALQLYSKIREGVVLLSKERELLYWNQSARQMLGFPPGTGSPEKLNLSDYLEGFTSDQIIKQDFRRKIGDSKVKKRSLDTDENLLDLKSPMALYLEVSKSVIPLAGKDEGDVFVFRDITEMKIASEKIRILYSRILKDLDFAKEIQSTITTRDFPSSDEFRIYSYFRPYDRVGGDVLNCESTEKESIDVLFADVSGHGISSAMVAAMASIGFSVISQKGTRPKEGLLFTNELLSSVVTQHFISAVYLKYEYKKRRLLYSYAGHHCGLLLRKNKVTEIEGKGGVLLAVGTPILNEYEIVLEPGDRIIFYSDGLFEVTGTNGVPLGNKALIEEIKKLSNRDSESLIRALVLFSESFGSGVMSDDVTLFCLEVKD